MSHMHQNNHSHDVTYAPKSNHKSPSGWYYPSPAWWLGGPQTAPPRGAWLPPAAPSKCSDPPLAIASRSPWCRKTRSGGRKIDLWYRVKMHSEYLCRTLNFNIVWNCVLKCRELNFNTWWKWILKYRKLTFNTGVRVNIHSEIQDIVKIRHLR